MDKLRNIANWLWLNKERMVLAALVVVLCFRGYKVAYPDKPTERALPRLPQPELPQPWKDKPPDPPPLPAPVTLGRWDTLWKENPFTVFEQNPSGLTESKEPPPRPLNIQVARIMTMRDGTHKAQLKLDKMPPKLCAENDQIGNFQVTRIDPQAQSVEVFDNQQGKSFIITSTGK